MTSDSHVSPDLEHELPRYCPEAHVDDYRDWMAASAAKRALLDKEGFFVLSPEAAPDVAAIHSWNLQTEGQHDVHARLRDMNRDGVAAEVIFHGSPPTRPIPFLDQGIAAPIADPRLAAVGQAMYNDWLADFCSVEPERHIGLAHLPLWDIPAAIRELERAREAGLRGVNFPTPRTELIPYEDPAWEPFWSACEDLEMPLACHGGGGASTPAVAGPTGMFIYIAEAGALSRISPLVRLVFGGVFERHPRLKLVQTEQVGAWYGHVVDELDSIWEKFWYGFPESMVPRRPSEYCRENYFVGASFQSRVEAETAVRDDYVDNVMWGSDYPHPEGTFHFQADPDETPMTRLAMRNTFAGLPDDAVRGMLGENGVRVYGLDAEKLRDVAIRIGGPTLDEVSQPVTDKPTHWGFAFRDTTTYV
jgi:predicted TIM-barrel fold metal-dependent hydrolase